MNKKKFSIKKEILGKKTNGNLGRERLNKSNEKFIGKHHRKTRSNRRRTIRYLRQRSINTFRLK
jgi:hypothetical protein